MNRREFLTALAALTGAAAVPAIAALPDIIHADWTYCHVFSKHTQDVMIEGFKSSDGWVFYCEPPIWIRKADQLEVHFDAEKIRLRVNGRDLVMFNTPSKAVEIWGYKGNQFFVEIVKA